MVATAADILLEDLHAPNAFPLFVTGAGISLASGIPTFRGDDPDAVWANDVLEKGTLRYFQRNPVQSWLWYLDRFSKTRSAKPNPGHIALAEIEAKLLAADKRCLTVTQNIDGLHKEAGTKNLFEVHGCARKMRCVNNNCVNGPPKGSVPWDDALFEAFLADPNPKTLPRCKCRNLYRAHVLWFDEGYNGHDDYGIDPMLDLAEKSTVMVFIGTSFAVGVTLMLTMMAHEVAKPMFVIDPNIKEADQGMTLIKARSEVFLPQLAEAL